MFPRERLVKLYSEAYPQAKLDTIVDAISQAQQFFNVRDSDDELVIRILTIVNTETQNIDPKAMSSTNNTWGVMQVTPDTAETLLNLIRQKPGGQEFINQRLPVVVI